MTRIQDMINESKENFQRQKQIYEQVKKEFETNGGSWDKAVDSTKAWVEKQIEEKPEDEAKWLIALIHFASKAMQCAQEMEKEDA